MKPGGMLFCRLATNIGLEQKFNIGLQRNYSMPNGKTWFLADAEWLRELEVELKMERLDPLKTTVVEEDRSMTTWVLKKQN